MTHYADPRGVIRLRTDAGMPPTMPCFLVARPMLDVWRRTEPPAEWLPVEDFYTPTGLLTIDGAIEIDDYSFDSLVWAWLDDEQAARARQLEPHAWEDYQGPRDHYTMVAFDTHRAETIEPGYQQRLPEHVKDTLATAIDTFHVLVRQRFVSVREEVARDRDGRRMGAFPTISVVTLRGTDYIPRNDEPGFVDWSSRWLVRGHSRHLASGKVVPVRPHVKGPADKPLVLKDRVYRWSR